MMKTSHLMINTMILQIADLMTIIKLLDVVKDVKTKNATQ